VLVATLVQAVLASLLLIAAPLAWATRRAAADRRPAAGSRRRVLAYFTAIGFAFMFVEIAFIQKLVLFLGHPLYAVAVVLFAFLLFAGLGSIASRHWSAGARARGVRAGVSVVLAIAASALLDLVLLAWLFRHAMALPDAMRIAIAAALVAPLAFFMGMPFPTGLAWVEASDPRLVPWAWGINGCASVVGAVLATLLAIHVGFTAVVAAALALYAVAAAVPPGLAADTANAHNEASRGTAP
jgi:hypothetical protein